MRLPSSLKLALAGGFGTLLAGCPNPNMYQTPRTTPAGRFQHAIALEAVRLSADVPTTGPTDPQTGQPTVTTKEESVTLPMAPSYQMRIGLHDQVDLGLRIANLSSAGADVKWNFLRTETFDLAVDPGIQGTYFSVGSGNAESSTTLIYGHFPIIMGINVSESVTIVPTVGATFTSVDAALSADGREAIVTSGDGLSLRGSLGLQFRVTKRFALFPEVTAMRFFNDAGNLYLVGGLGFNIGTIPAYDRTPAAEEEAAPAKKPAAPPPPPPPLQEKKPAPAAPVAEKPTPNGAPPPVVAVEPTAPNTCKTTCVPTDSSGLTREEAERVATSLEPLMKELRGCLDRIGGQAIRPAAFLRYTGPGVAPVVRIDVSGYEEMACVKDAESRARVSGASHVGMLRCEARCK